MKRNGLKRCLGNSAGLDEFLLEFSGFSMVFYVFLWFSMVFWMIFGDVWYVLPGFSW